MANRTKHPGGRPESITPEVLAKLESGFMNGFTDCEACLFADINPSTLYRYIDSHPEFSKRKEQLKKSPLIKAKLNINKALQDKDKDISKWYLERKAKDEFSTRSEVTGADAEPFKVVVAFE